MTVYHINDKGEFVEKYPEAKTRVGYVISDTMNPTRHTVNGKMYDSKSAFRSVTKDAGCVEVGNDKLSDSRRYDMGDRKADIRRAIEQLTGR